MEKKGSKFDQYRTIYNQTVKQTLNLPKNTNANKIDKVNNGYDVISEKFCDLITAGVVDPTKVTRTALEKAVSVAGTLLTTECMVVNEPSDDKK